MISFIVFTILLNVHCDSNEPPQGYNPPGRRDYVWTVDTLYRPNNTLNSIWGASPNDIWLCVSGGITSYDRLWYYDGIKWEPFQITYLKITT